MAEQLSCGLFPGSCSHGGRVPDIAQCWANLWICAVKPSSLTLCPTLCHQDVPKPHLPILTFPAVSCESSAQLGAPNPGAHNTGETRCAANRGKRGKASGFECLELFISTGVGLSVWDCPFETVCVGTVTLGTVHVGTVPLGLSLWGLTL